MPYSFPTNTDHYPLTQLPHLPVKIEGNSNFTKWNGVNSGNGTRENPFVLENLRITAREEGFCIYIGNTTAWFVVKNCRFGNGSIGGIVLWNVVNGTIEQNKISACNSGIYIAKGKEISIRGNRIERCATGARVYAVQMCRIENNSFWRKEYGVHAWYGKELSYVGNNASENSVCGFAGYGIENTTFSGNSFSANGIGIYLYYSCNNQIIADAFYLNLSYGIYLDYGCQGNIVKGCLFYMNNYTGKAVVDVENENRAEEVNSWLENKILEMPVTELGFLVLLGAALLILVRKHG
ncbi:MAG: right-handed parallel beta-helix repeat-containing protein [Thermoplasmata archaeon]